MFALIQGVLLRPLPFPDQSRLIVGWRALPENPARHWPFRAADLDVIKRESRLIENIAGVGYQEPSSIVLVDREAATSVQGARVTGEFFDVLGIHPIIGRTLTPQDDLPGAENVLVITHHLWQGRYGGSHDVVGRRLLIGDQPFTIVGVMPPDVDHPHRVDAWMTVAAMETTATTFRGAMRQELLLLGRLRGDVTLDQASAELQSLARPLAVDRPLGDPRDFVSVIEPYHDFLVRDVRRPLYLLFAAVGFVLLVACANVANLLLMRGEDRRPEFAMRAALGAGRGRLARQVLAESWVLATVAGVVALVAATWTLPILMRWIPEGLPRMDLVRVDPGVAAFGFVLSLFVVSLAGLVPALTVVETDLDAALRGASRRTTGRRGGRAALVVSQVALAVAVVAAAGLLTRSLLRLRAVGFQLASDRMVYVPLQLPRARYADRGARERFMTELTARLDATPPIAAATPINLAPFSGLGWDAPTFTAEGQSIDRAVTNPALNLEEIHPNYFKAFAVPLLRGRPFTEDDRQTSAPVAIVSSDIAERTWPGENPIGKRLKMGSTDSPDAWRTIVGVTAPTRYREIRELRPTLYVPASQFLGAATDLVLRTSAPPSVVHDLVRAQVNAIDSNVELLPPRPFSALLDVPFARPMFLTLMLALFSATALGLAAIGLYAAMATSVRRRRHELGVRIALGATPRDVRRLVLSEAFGLVSAGVALGLALGSMATRLLRGLLFEVQPLDPISLTGTIVLLLAFAALALYLPVRHAVRIEPTEMLRSE
jgi:predicted permease